MLIPYREETQKVSKIAKAKIKIKIIKLQNHNLYLIYSLHQKIADGVRIRLSRILSNTDDFIEKIY